MKPIDHTQFGKSKAAIHLAELLTELDKSNLARKISCVLCHWARLLNAASMAPLARELLLLVKRQMVWAFENDIVAPEQVKRFCRSILTGKYRELLKQA